MLNEGDFRESNGSLAGSQGHLGRGPINRALETHPQHCLYLPSIWGSLGEIFFEESIALLKKRCQNHQTGLFPRSLAILILESSVMPTELSGLWKPSGPCFSSSGICDQKNLRAQGAGWCPRTQHMASVVREEKW